MFKYGLLQQHVIAGNVYGASRPLSSAPSPTCSDMKLQATPVKSNLSVRPMALNRGESFDELRPLPRTEVDQ